MRATPIGNEPASSVRTAVEPAALDAPRRRAVGARARAAAGGEVDEVGDEAAAAAVPLERGEHVVLDGQPAERLDPLERAAQPVARALDRRRRRDVAPVEDHAALVRRTDARDDVEQRGLAGTVRPDDPEHLTASASRLTPLRAAMPPNRTWIESRAPAPLGRLGTRLQGSCASGCAIRRRRREAILGRLRPAECLARTARRAPQSADGAGVGRGPAARAAVAGVVRCCRLAGRGVGEVVDGRGERFVEETLLVLREAPGVVPPSAVQVHVDAVTLRPRRRVEALRGAAPPPERGVDDRVRRSRRIRPRG